MLADACGEEMGPGKKQDGADPTAAREEVETRSQPPLEPTEFDVLFTRAYPAGVGLCMRVLDRDGQARDHSLALAEELAIDALARARVRHLRDTPESLARILGWVIDACLSHLAGHPGRVPLPADVDPEDLLPQDLLDAGMGQELALMGLPLDELQAALMGTPRRTRRLGLACLGAGLSVEETAALFGVDTEEVDERIRRVATRLADRRRVDPELVLIDGPAEDPT